MTPEPQAAGGSWSSAAKLVAAIALCFVPAAISVQFRPDDWYRSLVRPPLAPPDWVFGPVWTLLYTLMGVSLWLVWRRTGPANAPAAWGLFATQLTLNGLWSWLFFGRHEMLWALVDLLLLAAVLALTIGAFRRHSSLAARLLYPYLAWVLFAGYLNAGYWRLNTGGGG
jgi:benzodiazapine receptor